MIEFFGTVFVAFLVIVIIVVVVLIVGVFSVLRAGKNHSSGSRQQGYNNNGQHYNQSGEKHFSKEEGEYVDFEEMKDDK